MLEFEIKRVWENNLKVYGANKIWRQLLREGICVARCTAERLMKVPGIQSVRRGKKYWTTIAGDLLNRLLSDTNIPVIPRIPLNPGITTTEENL